VPVSRIVSEVSTTKAARKSGLDAVDEGLEAEKLAIETGTFILTPQFSTLPV
jgi:hypothetical protein